MSVNTSPSQLATVGFSTTVLLALRHHDVDPSSLKMEVTESVLLDSAGQAAPELTSLSQMGVQISLDDFGSGYSSLSYLGQFEMQELKLYGTFINGLEREVGRSVLRGVVDIAHAIGARVVAEKVDLGQGFIFSQALPPERLGQWLTDRNQSTDLTWHATA